MQDLSYTPVNQVFRAGNYEFTVTVYTFRNAFTLSPEDTVIRTGENGFTAECSALLWGGQEKENASACVRAEGSGDRVRIYVSAKMARSVDVIRRVKIALLHMEKGQIINSIDVRRSEIPSAGLFVTYPEGWRECGTPLVIMKEKESLRYFRCLDEKVRDKRFVFIPEDEEHATVELIHEEEAVSFSSRINVPVWEIGSCSTVEEAYRGYIPFIEKKYGLKRFEERDDVPEWFREVSLVASVHGQHWTGHIFNDYAAMLDTAKRLVEKIDPKKVLLYLPGWEGRYYWQYGDYRPDERMGGKEGFKKLIDGVKALGMHVMPMFGMNVVGVHLEDFQRWGAPGISTRASGNRSNGSVDWDASRHYDHGSNRTLHPGAPQWNNRLCDQICELADDYGFDAVFLDIMACWCNDPNFAYYDGVKKLVEKIRAAHPELLISGEGWYDGLMALSPLLQSGHTDGKMHYHDTAYPPMFDTYVREFGHLCLGDPAFLSTGVHEQGHNPEWRTPLTKGVIPTLTVIDGTLDGAPERVDMIIGDAEEYYRRYCVK